MIISTTENQAWRELSAVDKKGIELSIVGERQAIRGFGTCFSELSALALDSIGADLRIIPRFSELIKTFRLFPV